MLLQETSLYICSNSKYFVHGLFKIIQNYVNIKINKLELFFSSTGLSMDWKLPTGLFLLINFNNVVAIHDSASKISQ